MRLISRLTTRYDSTEDRIALHGDCGSGEVQTAWMTRVFADALVGELLGQVDGTAAGQEQALPPQRTAAEQGFRQQAARQAQARQASPPVSVKQAERHREWLATRASAKRSGEVLRLVLRGRGGPEEGIAVDLSGVRLRQWLNVLVHQYQRAGWPLEPWPEWMLEQLEDGSATAPGSVH